MYIISHHQCLRGFQMTWVNIGLMSRAFDNGLGDRGSIANRVIPKTWKKKKEKKVLDATLLGTQHYKVHIKGKVE